MGITRFSPVGQSARTDGAISASTALGWKAVRWSQIDPGLSAGSASSELCDFWQILELS